METSHLLTEGSQGGSITGFSSWVLHGAMYVCILPLSEHQLCPLCLAINPKPFFPVLASLHFSCSSYSPIQAYDFNSCPLCSPPTMHGFSPPMVPYSAQMVLFRAILNYPPPVHHISQDEPMEPDTSCSAHLFSVQPQAFYKQLPLLGVCFMLVSCQV
jgi:hypothetical protein